MSSSESRLSSDSTEKLPHKSEIYASDLQEKIDAVAHEVGDVYSITESFTADDLELIFSHMDDRPFEESLEIFRDAVEYHKFDTGISNAKLEWLDALAKGPLDGQSESDWETTVKFETFVIHEWSIYPEVRAVTRPPFLESEAVDGYGILGIANGILWGAAGAVISTFFEPRYPSLSIGSMSLQILIAGTGFLIAKLPRIEFPIGFGRKCLLSTGRPWSYQEQMLASLTMSVSNGYPYAQDVVISQANDNFYGFKEANQFGYIIMLILSSSFMGFGVIGVFRAAVIYPSKLVYYTMLPTLALSRTLIESDAREAVNGWRLKRWEFFTIVTVICFGWYWIVNLLMQFFKYFTWMCWAAPENINVNAITGSNSGVGLNPFPTFDLNIMGQFGGIAMPVWAYTNIMAGLAISTFAVCIMWWTNVSQTAYLPINTNLLFDNQGNEWEVGKVLDAKTRKLDETKYQKYSLPYWSAGNVVSYGSFFMVYPAGFLSAWLNNWSDQIEGYKNVVTGLKMFRGRGSRSVDNFHDAFSRRIQRYPEVPELWYLFILLGSIGMAIGTVEGFKFTETPVWAIFLGIGLACVFIPLVSALLARTGQMYETNVLYEMIMGYAVPGNSGALLVGKAFATNFFSQAENWIENQKQAHYVGIPPRVLFWAQCLSTLVACFVQAGIITFQLGGGIHDMCNPKNKQGMTCQDSRTYFNASVMWGVIGPKRVFETVYPKIKWCFLIGAVYPLPFWVVRRFGPSLASRWQLKKGSWAHYFVSAGFLRYFNETVILIGCISYWGASNWSYVLMDFYISLFFGLFVKKRFPLWWSKYAYLVAAACSNGTSWAGFFEFWATQYNHIVNVNWWGNNASANTLDNNYSAVRLPLNVTAGEYFGPRKGHFP